MRRLAAASVVIVIAIGAALAPSGVSVAEDDTCAMDISYMVSCELTTPPGLPGVPDDPPGDPGGGGGGGDGPPSPIITTYTLIVPSTPCAPGYSKYRIEVRWRATGALINANETCVADGDPPPAAPPPPPPPPRLGQVVSDAKPLLRLRTGLNPPRDRLGGVSQLETWLWCDQDGAVTVDVDLNGWRVVAVARIEQLVWVIEGPDGHIERAATSCGSEPDPESDGSSAAAFWTPNLPGEYTVTLAGTWGGTWTRSFGTFSETLDLGTLVVTNAPVSYPVVEIQTVGVGN